MSNFFAVVNEILYKSVNDGVTWTNLGTITFTGTPTVGGLVVLDDGQTVVAAAGSEIRRSINGGATWNTVYSLSDLTIYYLEKSRTSDYLFAVGHKAQPSYISPQFLRSTDKGATWTLIQVVPGVATVHSYGTACSFINDSVGWLVSYYSTLGKIYKTVDGGDTWTLQRDGLSGTCGIFALDANNIWVVSYTNTVGVWKSIDGGENWTEYLHGGLYGLHMVFATDANHVWASGGIAATRQCCYSLDGGENWTCVTESDAGGPVALYGGHVYFVNTNVGYLTGSRFFKSTDGGQTWVLQGAPSAGIPQIANYFDVEFATQFRAFDITEAEPTDRTTQGIVISASNNPLNFGSVGAGNNSAVKCLIFRAVGLGVYTTISDMRFWLQAKELVGTNNYYCDITNIWTQNKTPAQVAAGTPGTIPQSLPGVANLTKIGGGDITGAGHADTSQYIYLCQYIGDDEVGGEDIDMNYRVQYDYA